MFTLFIQTIPPRARSGGAIAQRPSRCRGSVRASIAHSRLACVLALCGLLAGCAQKTAPPTAHTAEPEPQRVTRPHAAPAATQPAARVLRPEQIDPAADPLAYLRAVRVKCAELSQYVLTFTRQERRGLGIFKSMHGPERIRCWFRRQPFSVKMVWLDPKVKYGQSCYVAEQFGNKVRFIPRHGLFGLPPGISRVDLSTPVTFGESRYKLTDFGLERTMERLLDAIGRANGAETIAVDGPIMLDDPPRQAYKFRVEVPHNISDTPISEVFIDTQTNLPIATRLYSPSGKLEAAYTYRDLDTGVILTDADFLLDAERDDPPAAAAPGGGGAPAAGAPPAGEAPAAGAGS